MRYFQCKCGKKTAWSTRGVQDCEGCKECGTTFDWKQEHKHLKAIGRKAWRGSE